MPQPGNHQLTVSHGQSEPLPAHHMYQKQVILPNAASWHLSLLLFNWPAWDGGLCIQAVPCSSYALLHQCLLTILVAVLQSLVSSELWMPLPPLRPTSETGAYPFCTLATRSTTQLHTRTPNSAPYCLPPPSQSQTT